MAADFFVEDEGTVLFFLPQTTRARGAVNDLGLEPWQRLRSGFAVDHRHVRQLIRELGAEGFTFEAEGRVR
jgi:hypothetical protein